MAGRLFLSLMAVALCRAAPAQPLEKDTTKPDLSARPPGLVVTLGSTALTHFAMPCRSVCFTPDSRHVRVLVENGWHRWDIATGRMAEAESRGDMYSDDVLYPAPDGQTVLCLGRRGANAGKVRVFDMKGRFELRSKTFDPTERLVPSDDCTCVAVASARSATVVWLDAKTPSTVVEGITDVRRLAKAANVNVLAFLGDDRVAVWTADALWKLDLPKDTVFTAAALTADGSTLATASAVETDNGKRPGPVELWDVKARKKLRTMASADWFSEAPYRLRFTPDGRTLVAGDGAYLRGWSTSTGTKTFAVEPGWGWVGNVQISPNGQYVAVSYPGRPMVYEVATGRQPEALLGHSRSVWEVAISPDGRRVATAMYGSPTVYTWDAKTGQNRGELQAHFGSPADGGRVIPGRLRVQFSPDGSKLLTTNDASGANPPLRIWDANSHGLLREIPVPGREAATAAFTRNGLFTILDRKPTLLDIATGKAIWEKPTVPPGARIAVSPRGDRVAVEGRKGTAVWDATGGKELDVVPGEPVAFTEDGLGLVLEGNRHSASIRQLDSKKPVRIVENDPDPQPFVASSTGLIAMRFVLTGTPEYRITQAATLHLVATVEVSMAAPDGRVFPADDPDRVLKFSPDGRTFAVVGSSVKLYETYSGREVQQWDVGHAARTAAFSADGRTLFTTHGAEDDGSQVLGWDTTGGAWGVTPVVRAEEVAKLTAAFNDKPAAARKALYQLATRPAEAIAFAREVTKLATAADYADYEKWLTELDAPAFQTREAATKALAKAGWRAEAGMRQTLAKTESVEVRERLEKLLTKRDMRPLRAVHLLEVIGSPAAVAVLREVAGGPADGLVVQDAKWSLQRLESRQKR